MVSAKNSPVKAPMNKAGAKVPPTPPAPKVKAVAKAFNRMSPANNARMLHSCPCSLARKGLP